jgi:hypothetical protein
MGGKAGVGEASGVVTGAALGAAGVGLIAGAGVGCAKLGAMPVATNAIARAAARQNRFTCFLLRRCALNVNW